MGVKDGSSESLCDGCDAAPTLSPPRVALPNGVPRCRPDNCGRPLLLLLLLLLLVPPPPPPQLTPLLRGSVKGARPMVLLRGARDEDCAALLLPKRLPVELLELGGW